jgi:hypothetical protein
MASNTRSARAAYEEVFGPGFSDSTDSSEAEDTSTGPPMVPTPKCTSPAAAMPKPTPSQSARYQSGTTRKLPFEKTKFYGAYLDGTNPEAFEHYQDAQPQYLADGQLVREGLPTETLRSRRRTSATKRSPPAPVPPAIGRHPVRAPTTTEMVPRAPGIPSASTAATATSPPAFKTGVNAIGHRLHVRTTVQLQAAPWNTTGDRLTMHKRPASCTTTAPTSSSPSSSTTATRHVRHARNDAKKQKTTKGAVLE